MRATVSDQGSRDVSNLRSSRILAVLLSLPMCVVTACAADTAPEATTTQPILSGCHILRPYGWDNGFTVCSEPEYTYGSIDLGPGESATFYSGDYGYPYGTGSVTVVCHSNGDGGWDETNRTCFAGG
ncbi:MAG TPA: hypothetical protein VF516_29165 [Kofleriaceae bacterium]